jgi:hypothetical protein
MMARDPQAKDFTIGWICALPVELTAAKAMLDDVYKRSSYYDQHTLGRIGIHSIVITCLPAGQIGTGSATAAAVEMQSRFPGRTCNKCCKDRVIERERRKNDGDIVIHCGTVASGNQVIKDAITRDKWSSEFGGNPLL